MLRALFVVAGISGLVLGVVSFNHLQPSPVWTLWDVGYLAGVFLFISCLIAVFHKNHTKQSD